ncbi:uncharacterized protein RCH25_008095 [Pelodytes ibericus]
MVDGPIAAQEGEDVTLECITDLDLENFTFQKYSRGPEDLFSSSGGRKRIVMIEGKRGKARPRSGETKHHFPTPKIREDLSLMPGCEPGGRGIGAGQVAVALGQARWPWRWGRPGGRGVGAGQVAVELGQARWPWSWARPGGRGVGPGQVAVELGQARWPWSWARPGGRGVGPGQWMKMWIDLGTDRYLRCWYFNLNVTRDDGRLLLQIREISDWQSGPYRCVKKGNDSTDIVSNNFTIPVTYLHDIYLQRPRAWNPNVYNMLLVEEGSDVEVKCSASSSQEPEYEWSMENMDYIIPSDTLTLDNVNIESSGRYTCMARNLGVFPLVKTKSFQLQVMPRRTDFSYGGFRIEDIVLYVAVPTLGLVLFLLTVVILIARHRKLLRKPQISLVDCEKRSPIYKGSSQFLSSSTSDTQPLVM